MDRQNFSTMAVACFKQGFSCSQAIFSAFGPQLGLDKNIALKIADGFGGGMGRMALTCGAVTGAFMVIGLKHGRQRADDHASKQKTLRLMKEFIKRFKDRNQSISCKELLGCDISTDEGLEYLKKNGIADTRCPGFVSDAAQILEELFQEFDSE